MLIFHTPSQFFTAAFAFLMATAFLSGCGHSESTSAEGESKAEAKGDKESSSKKGEKALETGKDVLEAMAKKYRNAKTYVDQAKVYYKLTSGEKKSDQKYPFGIAYERPGKMRLEVYGANLLCDGKTIFGSVISMPGQILKREAPTVFTLDSLNVDPHLTGELSMGLTPLPPTIPLLLADNALDYLLKDAEEPKLADPGEIEGHECYRVQIRWPQGMGTFWIDKNTMLLRKIMYPLDDLRDYVTRQNEDPIDFISLYADFEGAAIDEPIKPETFSFQVPDGAKVTRHFIPPHPGQLLAKKAPDVKFTELDGVPMEVKAMQGKIAVLMFWSATDGASITRLSNLQKVAGAYKNNDKIAFYAVNIDPKEITNEELEKVFKDAKIEIPILRDPDNAVLAFQFISPPYSFIIDAAGFVQDHEGGGGIDWVDAYKKKLDAVLAGNNIFEAGLKKYEEDLKQYEESLAKLEKQTAGETNTAFAVPEAKVAEKTDPVRLKMTSLWKSTDVKNPGNIVVIPNSKGEPEFLVVDGWKTIVRLDAAGHVLKTFAPKLEKVEVIPNLRYYADGKKKTWIAAFGSTQQRCHVLDGEGNPVFIYPTDALEHPHSGIADALIADLENDGRPELYIGYNGVVGVQAVSMDGKRLWTNRAISNVRKLAVTEPDGNGRQFLACTNMNGNVVYIDSEGKNVSETYVPNEPLYWICSYDFQGKGQYEWCGLASPKLGETHALGFTPKGESLWTFDLPSGMQNQPIEQIIPGRVSRRGEGQWILPGADGSINILGLDGSRYEQFNYGAVLQGIATATIDGNPVLLISTLGGLEAWKIE